MSKLEAGATFTASQTSGAKQTLAAHDVENQHPLGCYLAAIEYPAGRLDQLPVA